MATKAKKKKATYQRHHEEWKENQEIIKRHPELPELLIELAKAKQAAEDSKTTYEALREKIGKIMKSRCVSKIFNLAAGLQVTISEYHNRTSYKFNEEKFRKEHPNLYKLYLEPTKYTTYGGQLTVRKLNQSCMEDYSEFEDEVK